MNPKIAPERLRRSAVVYVRQSSIEQVLEHTERQRRQYSLADTARAMGFAAVDVIDVDGLREAQVMLGLHNRRLLRSANTSPSISAVS